MEDSVLPLDLFPMIGEYMDCSTLETWKKVCWDMYYISTVETEKRLRCDYPLNSVDTLLVVNISDYLINISVQLDDYSKIINETDYNISWCEEFLLEWFMKIDNVWRIRYKLFKSIIRYINRCYKNTNVFKDGMKLKFTINKKNRYEYELISVSPL